MIGRKIRKFHNFLLIHKTNYVISKNQVTCDIPSDSTIRFLFIYKTKGSCFTNITNNMSASLFFSYYVKNIVLLYLFLLIPNQIQFSLQAVPHYFQFLQIYYYFQCHVHQRVFISVFSFVPNHNHFVLDNSSSIRFSN